MKKKEEMTAIELFMSQGTLYTIQDWNERREEAKEHFTVKEITELDQSGFIKEFNLVQTARDSTRESRVQGF